MSNAKDQSGSQGDPGVHAVAVKALEWIVDGASVGLGSGRAASLFITLLGARVRDGLRVTGVPTSRASADLGASVGIPIVGIERDTVLDVTVDGADEVAPNLDVVKGWGGALVRERIVAASSRSQIILVGADKLVRAIGQRGRIPVEVIPLARWLATRHLAELGLVPALRLDDTGQPFITDNGNLILDCAPPQSVLDHATVRELEQAVIAIVGVVDTGLFLGTASTVLVGHSDGRVDVMHRPDRPGS